MPRTFKSRGFDNYVEDDGDVTWRTRKRAEDIDKNYENTGIVDGEQGRECEDTFMLFLLFSADQSAALDT